MVTESLFRRYRRAEDWAGADLATLEREIYSTGFFRAKARALTGMAKALVERHRGEVPRTLEELTALPGVGRKTASVVLGNAFGVPALAVDTHVARVAQRLGLTAGHRPRGDPRGAVRADPTRSLDHRHPPPDRPRPPHLSRPTARVPPLPGASAVPVARPGRGGRAGSNAAGPGSRGRSLPGPLGAGPARRAGGAEERGTAPGTRARTALTRGQAVP